MHENSITFIGNATTLIRFAGFTLLTDPNFVHRGAELEVAPGIKITRLTDPAMDIDDLPELDAVVISHLHADHFDEVAEERLSRDVPIVTTPSSMRKLEEKGFGLGVGLDTWASHEMVGPEGALRLTALPARHGPAGVDLVMPETMGTCMEFWRGTDEPAGPPDLRLYQSGDTLMFEGIREIGERIPQIDVALLHLGGTRIMGLTVTLDGSGGLEVLQAIDPRVCVPIHFNDYDAFKSPLEEFVSLAREAGLADRLALLDPGAELSLEDVAAVAR